MKIGTMKSVDGPIDILICDNCARQYYHLSNALPAPQCPFCENTEAKVKGEGK